MDDHGKLARGHLGQIPKTLVVAMSLLDGGSQRIRGTDVGSLERGRCGDQDPVVGVAVGVDLTVHSVQLVTPRAIPKSVREGMGAAGWGRDWGGGKPFLAASGCCRFNSLLTMCRGFGRLGLLAGLARGGSSGTQATSFRGVKALMSVESFIVLRCG